MLEVSDTALAAYPQAAVSGARDGKDSNRKEATLGSQDAKSADRRFKWPRCQIGLAESAPARA